MRKASWLCVFCLSCVALGVTCWRAGLDAEHDRNSVRYFGVPDE